MRKRQDTPLPGKHGMMLELYLLYTFGPRLRIEDLGELLGWSRASVFAQLAAGTFPISTYLDTSVRYADYRDVAQYLERCREEAAAAQAPRARRVRRKAVSA